MATTPPAARSRRQRPALRLAAHYLEMVAAMFAGMLVVGGARDLLGATVAFADRPGLSFVLMATDMSIGMGAWMRLRGHSWASTLQMCVAMYAPVFLLPLHWAGALGSMAFMVLAHVLMMLAMLVVLLGHELPLPTASRASS